MSEDGVYKGSVKSIVDVHLGFVGFQHLLCSYPVSHLAAAVFLPAASLGAAISQVVAMALTAPSISVDARGPAERLVSQLFSLSSPLHFFHITIRSIPFLDTLMDPLIRLHSSLLVPP